MENVPWKETSYSIQSYRRTCQRVTNREKRLVIKYVRKEIKTKCDVDRQTTLLPTASYTYNSQSDIFLQKEQHRFRIQPMDDTIYRSLIRFVQYRKAYNSPDW